MEQLLGEKSKVNIKWKVLPFEYTHEKERDIVSEFSKKYGIQKDNVKVTPIFIEKRKNGEIVPYSNDITENIQNKEFQQQLFKKYLNEKEINDCNIDEIIAIDNEINARLNYEQYEQHKRYIIKWIKWDNFMSYGKGNYFTFENLNGLVLLCSEPANQGGKTTFCLDLLRFILFGKVTSRENDWTLSKVFNKHLPNETECVVEGCVSIDGCDYVIKRVVTRPSLDKRTEKSKVSQKVSYYKLVNNEYIDLKDEECQNEVSGTETNKAIKEALGNERDFDLMICVDSDNLKGLISLKDTERGRLISRWIGLLPLEDKDRIARDTFNRCVLPSLMLNKYNKDELRLDNDKLNEEINALHEENKTLTDKIAKSEKILEKHNAEKEKLLLSKKDIDESLMKVDVKTIEATLKSVIESGNERKIEKEMNEKRLSEIGKVEFDKTIYENLVKEKESINEQFINSKAKYNSLINEVDALHKKEFCPTCGARLKDVDNSKAIEEKNKEIEQLKIDGRDLNEKLQQLIKEIKRLDVNRDLYNEKDKLELLNSKIDVDIERLRESYKKEKRTLDEIEKNKQAIENNNKIENSLNIVKVNISTENDVLKNLSENLNENKSLIKVKKEAIEKNNKLVSVIEKEEEKIKSWKIYLELIGKNGISKLVLRTVLPLINGELKTLLGDVCDFDVEVSIDEHNDVAFYLIHDGIKSNLSSGSGFEQTVASLALRSVLSKISTFSKPSFVVFDEILGGVAEENYDCVRHLFDKIVSDYQLVLSITHNKNIFDWHKSTILVTKENNISKIKQC